MSDPKPVKGIMTRLSALMFMEWGVKGLWVPLAGIFLVTETSMGGLGFTETQKGMIIGLPMAVACFIAPFLGGQLTDRLFPTQKVIAVMLVGTGILMWFTADQTGFSIWMTLCIAFTILYVPTNALVNSLAMEHLSDPKNQFPKIRLWGTIGWIAVSWIFPMIWLQENLRFQLLPPFLKGDEVPMVTARMVESLKFGGGLAVILGFYCWFVLPNTPPQKEAGDKLAWVAGLKLFKKRSFSVLMIMALPVSILQVFYMMNTAPFLKEGGLQGSMVMPAMSLGQFSEIAALAFLGVLLTKLGFRTIMTIGIFCYALRYFIFGIPGVPVEVLVAVQLMHGLSFGCFYASAFIYVQRISPRGVHNTAQTLFIFVMFGLAPLIAGYWLNGWLADLCGAPNGVHNLDSYVRFWRITSVGGIISAALFWIFFRDETEDPETSPTAKA
ncbi:MAG: MFS transporter [Verrucomicrobiae bacterium]|nr:MFS transporter [Verrucomicrobiae bacterium]